MPLKLPEGKHLAIAICVDFDAHSIWMAAKHPSPVYLSRGEFGAEVGVSRLLALFRQYGIKATFFTPVHTMLTFPRQIEEVVKAGHEIAAHGMVHERLSKLNKAKEKKLLELQVEQHQSRIGCRPRGYRSPAWDITHHTLELLLECGFEWDSSLMGRDFEPYHPRPVTIDPNNGNQFGNPSPLLEFPVSWYLDDFPFVEYFPAGGLTGSTSSQTLHDRWKDNFDYAYSNVPNGVFILTVHTQTIGRAHHVMMLERLIQHINSCRDVWFASLSECYDCWLD